MAYTKMTVVDNETKLNAALLNPMQDAIIENESAAAANAKSIGQLSEEIAGKPRVYITGIYPTSKEDYVLAEMDYEHGPDCWHAYLEIKCQGTSSMAYPKKNFTIKLYSDEARETKLKKKMFGWPVASSKFVLKANYIDHSHARNVITARLWGEIVASRPDYDTLPEELRNSPNNGAIDGYPIVVYYNGNYEGVYTWNIGKDDWMWGMDEDNPNHVLLCAETNTDNSYWANPCNFRALWSGVDGTDWSVEVGTNSDAVKNSLNALITCVMGTDDDTFKATIGNYLDVQSAIDYYLLSCADCGIDSLAKNMLIGTYDLKVWRCGKYDLDSTWLLWWDGKTFIKADTPCPGGYQEKFSLLWERISILFADEIVERGRELRKTVLSYANIMSHFERFCASIGTETYADDLVNYPDIPSANTNNIWQLRNAVRDRLAYFDAWLNNASVGATYALPAAATFGTVTDVINTGVNVWDKDKDFTIILDMTPGAQTESEPTIFDCLANNTWNGIQLFIGAWVGPNYTIQTTGAETVRLQTDIPNETTERWILAIRHAAGSGTYEIYNKSETVENSAVMTNGYGSIPDPSAMWLGIGAANVSINQAAGSAPVRPWVGTMHRFEVYRRYLSDDEVAAFAAGMTE